MYVSFEDFEQNVGKYMMIAKKVDLFIVDSTQTTVWILRCRKNTLQTRLAKVLWDAYGTELHTMPSAEGNCSGDSGRTVCLGSYRKELINVASHFVTGHVFCCIKKTTSPVHLSRKI